MVLVYVLRGVRAILFWCENSTPNTQPKLSSAC